MRLSVRVGLRGWMIAIATLAVAWVMGLGIGHGTMLWSNTAGEAYSRETAAALLRDNQPDNAAEWLTQADEVGRLNQTSRRQIGTPLGLTVLGLVAGGIRVMLRWAGDRGPLAGALRSKLASACGMVAVVILAGLVLGGIAYGSIMVVVLSTID